MARFAFDHVRASRIERGLRAVRACLDERGAVAFAHSGSDDDAAYLGLDALVVTPTRAVGLVASSTAPRAEANREFASETGEVDVRTVDDPAGSVASVVDELTGEGATSAETPSPSRTPVVLTPRAVRHDVALFLERAGYDLASTEVVTGARVVKTPAERAVLRELGEATTAGFDTAAGRLATARDDDGVLRFDADDDAARPAASEREGADEGVLTDEWLSRSVAATLARRGVKAPGVHVEGGDPDGGVRAGRPVAVDCRPVAVDGSRLRATWTFVVDGDGGWERRAQLALDAAHRAGRDQLEAALDGEAVTVGAVAAEVRAELAAYGFEESSVAVHGVGLAVHERPQGNDAVERGQALVVAASVTRAADATTSERRRSDAITHVETVLLDDGVERLVTLPTSLSPSGVRRR